MMKNYVELLRSIDLNFEFEKPISSNKEIAIISIGKSAAFMYKKFVEKHPEYLDQPKIIILPEQSYSFGLEDIIFSSHPKISKLSFQAGDKLIKFINSQKVYNIIVLISGGASALIEKSSDPKSAINLNDLNLLSGKNILEINRDRIERSLIKGGKLAKIFSNINFTVFSMSDIPFENGEKLVGSMPFYSDSTPNSTLIKCADCISLRDHLSSYFNLTLFNTHFIDRYTDSVEFLTKIIKDHLDSSQKNLFITAEPTLKVERKGKGGRMSHLALSLLPVLDNSLEFYALSSDGMDGNSGFAGAVVTNLKRKYTKDEMSLYLRSFNSSIFLENEGFALKSGYTGINLNDFVLIRRKLEDPV